MVEIYVEGKLAAIKEGSSFEYIVENRAFTGADDYTMNISFPLDGCPQNVEIFGLVNRKDVEEGEANFNCDIREDDKIFKTGLLTVTEISEVEVKCQFLEGRSMHNFSKTFDEIYINELDLGEYDKVNKHYITIEQAIGDIDSGNNFVSLPWVNNSSGNMQNAMKWNEQQNRMEWDFVQKQVRDFSEGHAWSTRTDTCLSSQPYLIFITKKICEAVGYYFDFASWESSQMKYVIICNAVPYAWDDRRWATILPHWTVKEYFQQLEYLLKGEFNWDHKEKKVAFNFKSDILSGIEDVKIENVVDEFSAEVTKEDESEFIGSYDIKMANPGHRKANYMDCEWYVKLMREKIFNRNGTGGGGVVREVISGTGSTGGGGGVSRSSSYGNETLFGIQEFDTYEELRVYARQWECMPGLVKRGNAWTTMGTSLEERVNIKGGGVFYAKDIDTYFVLYCYKKIKNQRNTDFYDRYYRLLPVNQFGTKEVTPNNSNSIELGFVPAWLDNVDDEQQNYRGDVIFLECGDKQEGVEDYYGNPWSVSVEDRFLNFRSEYDEEGSMVQPQAARAISAGEKEKAHEYFNCIYVAWWKKDRNQRIDAPNGISFSSLMPCPVIDKVTVVGENNYLLRTPFNIRPKDQAKYAGSEEENIEAMRKYNFSWIADNLPSPRSIFNIKGKRYVCKKITATFTDRMSQLLKGEFYRLED